MDSLEKLVLRIRNNIEQVPDESFAADEKLAQAFFDLSETERLPRALRDFCLDLSLRARSIDAGPLALKNKKELLAEFRKRVAALDRRKLDAN